MGKILVYLNKFVLILSLLSKCIVFNFINYYKIFHINYSILTHFFFFQVNTKSFLKMELKSVFKKGIKRDLIKVNLFLYKFGFLWSYFFFNQISKKKYLNLTLLRSVFINKSSKLQYTLENYKCNYNIFFSNN